MTAKLKLRPGILGIALFFMLAGGVLNCARYTSRPRVFVLGLDGATWDLLVPWMEEGHLPNIKKLMDSGSHGVLRSCVPDLSAPAWTTAFTGVNPGKHGIFDFVRRLPGSTVAVTETARSRRAKPVWVLLSESGRRVGVMNVPLTWPPDDVNGFMISGFPFVEYRGYTYPKELEGKLGPYPLDRLGEELIEGKEEEKLKSIEHSRDTLGELTLKMMKKEKWDFFSVVFTGSDRVQHFYWKFMDSSHPLHDPAKGKLYGNSIRDYWIGMDKIVGRIVAALPAGTELMVISDHGFGPIRKEVRLSRWLDVSGINKWLGHATMGPVLITNGVTRTMLWGRNQTGNKDYEEFKNLFKEKLSSFRDPETGQKFFRDVYKREEVFGGRYMERACDIIALESYGLFMGTGSKGEKEIVGPVLSTSFSAWHQPEGIFIFKGPGVAASNIREGGDLVDIAPTILYLLKEEIPKSFDGKAMTWALDQEFVKKNPVRMSNKKTEDENYREETLSEEEKEKLKAIPYVK